MTEMQWWSAKRAGEEFVTQRVLVVGDYIAVSLGSGIGPGDLWDDAKRRIENHGWVWTCETVTLNEATVFDKPRQDAVNHPPHYNAHPSGVECITVVEHFNFNRGNAIKYIWRAGEKGHELEDLKKAEWYLRREIARLEKESST
jgi:hypothetical protein